MWKWRIQWWWLLLLLLWEFLLRTHKTISTCSRVGTKLWAKMLHSSGSCIFILHASTRPETGLNRVWIKSGGISVYSNCVCTIIWIHVHEYKRIHDFRYSQISKWHISFTVCPLYSCTSSATNTVWNSLVASLQILETPASLALFRFSLFLRSPGHDSSHLPQ